MNINFLFVLCFTSVFVISCGKSSDQNSQLSDWPRMTDALPSENTKKVTAELESLGFELKIDWDYTDEPGRIILFDAIAKDWAKLEPKFRALSPKAIAGLKTIFVSNHFGVHRETLFLSGKDRDYFGRYGGKQPEDLVSRTLDVTRKLNLHLTYSPRVIAVTLEGCLLAPTANFEALLKSHEALKNFATKNPSVIQAFLIGDSDRYFRSEKLLQVNPSSKNFLEILSAIQSNKLESLSLLIEMRD